MKRMLTASDVAKRAVPVVTREAVHAWERTGILLPTMRTPGGVRLYDEQAVEKFLARRAARGRRAPPPASPHQDTQP